MLSNLKHLYMNNIYLEIENILKQHRPSALCLITETKGSTPRKTASKMIVFANSEIIGTVGGGAIEKQISQMLCR